LLGRRLRNTLLLSLLLWGRLRNTFRPLLCRLLLNALLRLPTFLRRRRLLNLLVWRSRLLRSRTSLLPGSMLLAPAFILAIVPAFVPLRENCTHE
jgi:hypothetical protein